MIVEFYDRQDNLNPMNGTAVRAEKQLLKIFNALRNRPPFFCELVGENGYNLLVGIGEAFGCTQYGHQDGTPPYLMATKNDSKLNAEYLEFLIGDTPTPVPARYCLPFDLVKEIVIHFQKTGDRSSSVNWEEI